MFSLSSLDFSTIYGPYFNLHCMKLSSFCENDDGSLDVFVDCEAQGAICNRDAGAIFDTSYYTSQKHHCFWGCISCGVG
jgi:hypothetical protein